ncbi:MAG TPA: glycoside hydrolase family 2 TIM barrel-domain containing protein, partial [Candidatus Paceibacterota bacterium]|nr:glycoside hydrolase family 2 TIM barrel-domain containing protein [Candidatus Paceibacterota bacterium]
MLKHSRHLNLTATMMKLFKSLLPVLLGIFCWLSADAAEGVSLAGKWRFGLDRGDAGITGKWFNRDLPNSIQLPGALQSQRFGDEISTQTPWVLSLYDRLWYLRDDYKAYTNAGNVKVPFLCQPPRHYLGAAWYQREIEIPNDWEGRRVVLFLERPHWESRVWLDDRLIGTNNSLCVPHEFDLGLVNALGNSPLALLSPGKHTLTVRVDNRLILPYRPDAHAVSDSLGSTWNGIVGKMELRSTPPVWIEDVQVFPNVITRSVKVFGRIGMCSTGFWSGKIHLSVTPNLKAMFPSREYVENVEGNGRFIEFWSELELGSKSEEWSEFDPTLYSLWIGLESGNSVQQFGKRFPFGLREIKTSGAKLLINGREVYLRGTHNGGDFPLTGYPPTDVEYWRKLIRTCKEWGLNHIRFHSFCPPEAAFEAADELGFYLQPEPGMWNTFDPGSPMEQMLYLETERIIKAYGNHPSFIMLSPSNEPKGRWKQVLPKWAEHFRGVDPRRLYSSGTGFTDSDAPGPLDKVDYTSTARFGSKRIRGESGWFGRDYSNALQGVNVPVLAHELGQWCAYPD